MDVKNDPELYKYFDFSNAPEEHPLYKFNPENDKVLGKMKNESFVEKKFKDANGNKIIKNVWYEINEVIGIKPKVNHVEAELVGTQNIEWAPTYYSKKTNKGVHNVIMENEISIQDFKNCLDYNNWNYINYINGHPYYKTNDINLYHNFNRLASDKLNMYVYENRKVTMSNMDDKLWINPTDGISTAPHGYFNRST